jgi:LA2681-like HEPN
MARLRATAPAARSVLDGREHGGTLGRVGNRSTPIRPSKNVHETPSKSEITLNVIRNQLEHSYLKVHEILMPRAFREQFDKAWLDHLAHSVQREDFEAKTLHVFRMARAGLIYLSLGMHAEERRRAAAELKGPLAPMELPPFDENRRI